MRSDRDRLQDILDAIAVIDKYLPKDRAAFDADPPLQSHNYQHLMIVGEAVWCLSKFVKDAQPQVPWRQIEGMRHIMVHDYFKVDWDIVFATAISNIPTLKPTIQKMLAAVP